MSFRFFLFQAFPWTLRSKGGETQLQKQNSQKTSGHKCSERGDDLKPWIIPTRWWQLKYFLFPPRKLGFHDSFWRAYFSNGLVQPPTSPVFLKPFISETGFFLLTFEVVKHPPYHLPKFTKKKSFSDKSLALFVVHNSWLVRQAPT